METPVKAAWRRLTCYPARHCLSTVWIYLDNVLCVGLMERLFLSTDKSQFKEMWVKICLIAFKYHFPLSSYKEHKVLFSKFVCVNSTPISVAVALSWIKVGFSCLYYFKTQYFNSSGLFHGGNLKMFEIKKSLQRCLVSQLTVLLIQYRHSWYITNT